MPHGLQKHQGPGHSGAVWGPRGEQPSVLLAVQTLTLLGGGRSALWTLKWRTANSFTGSCFKGQIAGRRFFFSIHLVVQAVLELMAVLPQLPESVKHLLGIQKPTREPVHEQRVSQHPLVVVQRLLVVGGCTLERQIC